MKTKLNISIDVEVAAAAKQDGFNISQTCENALRAKCDRKDIAESAERMQAKKKNPDKLYVPGIGFVDKNSKQ